MHVPSPAIGAAQYTARMHERANECRMRPIGQGMGRLESRAVELLGEVDDRGPQLVHVTQATAQRRGEIGERATTHEHVGRLSITATQLAQKGVVGERRVGERQIGLERERRRRRRLGGDVTQVAGAAQQLVARAGAEQMLEQPRPAVALARGQIAPCAARRPQRGDQRGVQRRQAIADPRKQKLAHNVVHADEAQRRLEQQHQRESAQSVAQRLGVELVEAAGRRPVARENVERNLDVLGEHRQFVETRLLVGARAGQC